VAALAAALGQPMIRAAKVLGALAWAVLLLWATWYVVYGP
jgi:hypothetical protein